MEPTISLRDVVPTDFATFFEQEQDPKARAVVAYSNKRPTDRKTSDARWAKLVADSFWSQRGYDVLLEIAERFQRARALQIQLGDRGFGWSSSAHWLMSKCSVAFARSA